MSNQNENNDANNNNKSDTSPPSSNNNTLQSNTTEMRQIVGKQSQNFSDFINNNLIAVRFGVSSTILFLGIYGLANTPLFFRFRNVSEIPASYFTQRKRLYGRLIHASTSFNSNVNDKSIKLQIRHLSPIGQILPKSWFDFFIRFSPMASKLSQDRKLSGNINNNNDDEVLTVQLAGIQLPPLERLYYKPEQWLDKLVQERSLVSVTLLARQISSIQTTNNKNNNDIKNTIIENNKNYESMMQQQRNVSKTIQELQKQQQHQEKSSNNNHYHLTKNKSNNDSRHRHQVAIGKVTYRPTLFQLSSTDLAQQLIETGNGQVASSMIVTDNVTSQYKIVDASEHISNLKKDIQYLDRLTKSEMNAIKGSYGIWTDPQVREINQDIVQEVEFQTNATVWQRFWRWIRG